MLKLRSQTKRPEKTKAARPRSTELHPPTAMGKFLGWCVHGYTALGLVAAAIITVLLVRGGPECVRLVVLADDPGDHRRFHRRHPGPSGQNQGGRAGLRRPEARRHYRLSELHVSAAPADLACGASAARTRRVAAASPPGEHLRILSGSCQDRRRLFSRAFPRSGTWWPFISTFCRSGHGPAWR